MGKKQKKIRASQNARKKKFLQAETEEKKFLQKEIKELLWKIPFSVLLNDRKFLPECPKIAFLMF